LTDKKQQGFIISGIVGCGKTTLVEKVITDLSGKLKVFSYTGDDTFFRQKVSENSRFPL
jgi:Ni2+-binding GTPase involved in maturation of urease and hydrogenase